MVGQDDRRPVNLGERQIRLSSPRWEDATPSIVLQTAVEAVFIGKDRQYNRRFLRMCGHYLVEPVACTPASGWEKGQVENQVGLVRERFFTPRLRVASYEELNGWLLDRCVAYAKVHKHPELTDRTIWQAFEAERTQLTTAIARW